MQWTCSSLVEHLYKFQKSMEIEIVNWMDNNKVDLYIVHPFLPINMFIEWYIWSQTIGDAAGQTSKVIQDAKPIASSTVETISSADPVVIAGTAGAIFLTYFFLPPIWSAISFNLRGYKGKYKLIVIWCCFKKIYWYIDNATLSASIAVLQFKYLTFERIKPA